MSGEYSRVLTETLREFPDFSIVRKTDSRFMCLLGWLLFFNRGFMTGFHTTIGSTLYVTPGWEQMADLDRAALLRHERVHLRQQRRYGMALYAFLYTLLLPAVFTFRARLEQEAYEESLRAQLEYWGPGSFTPELREWYLRCFTGSAYFWMRPFRKSVASWYDGVLRGMLPKPD